jgi:hypothetical protein
MKAIYVVDHNYYRRFKLAQLFSKTRSPCCDAFLPSLLELPERRAGTANSLNPRTDKRQDAKRAQQFAISFYLSRDAA